MSGGFFNYAERHIDYVVEDLERIVKMLADDPHCEYSCSDETVLEMHNALFVLKAARIYATRIDYWLSSDDNETNFHSRLNEELSTLERNCLQS